MALSILAVAIDAFGIEPYRLTVEEVEIALHDLPPAWDGLRIVQISDLHISTMRWHEERVLRLLRELHPDLLVITGDLIEHVASYEVWAKRVEQVGAFLDRLPPATFGTWAVRGNTDISRYAGHSELLAQRVKRSGVNLLLNEHVELRAGTDSLHLAGIDWAHLPEGFAADFTVKVRDGNMVLAAGPSRGNSYTHYMPGNWPREPGGEYSGRFYYTDPAGGIGILFDSRLTLAENRFYRLRRYDQGPTWHLSPKGVPDLKEMTSGELSPEPNRWYRFRVRWRVDAAEARVQARIWLEGQAEPPAWQIDAVGPAHDERKAGLVGLWTVGPGWKFFDDLCFGSLDEGSPLWCEDFEGYREGDDPAHWLDFGVNKGNVAQAMRGVPEEAFTVLLAHSPDAIEEAAATGADLVLAGHTHGGQVRLPFVGSLYVNTGLGDDYNQGLHRFQNTWLYITRGIGTRAIPVRFLCPPEVTVITLRRR